MGGLPLRAIAIGLIVYGIVGIAIIVAAMLVTVSVFARLEALSESVAPPLRATARTIGDASGAFGRFAISLAEAQQSTDDAAQLAQDAAVTLSGVADAMSISIFGAQPLLPAAQGLRDVSGQLDGLGTDLAEVSDSLGNNISDVQRTGDNLRDVRAEMDTLLATFGASGGDETGTTGTTGGRFASLALYGLLLWLAIPAIASLFAGVALLRYARAVRRATRDIGL